MGQFRDVPSDGHRKTIDRALHDLPTKVKHTAFVGSEGLVHKGDKVHFDSASYREFGKRYAAAYLKVKAPAAR